MKPRILRGLARGPDSAEAVRALAEQIAQPDAATVVFVSPAFDLDALAEALRRRFDGPVIGCTTAGELTPAGYQSGGLTGFSIPRAIAEVRAWPLRDLSKADVSAFSALGHRVRDVCKSDCAADPHLSHFGVLLVDGMCRREEEVAGHLGPALGQMPLVGGSAGDDRRHERTFVLVDGRFEVDAAVLAVFATARPFTLIKSQNFESTGVKLVITRAERDQRLVRRIDGRPAAQAYAAAIGVDVDDLSDEIFSAHPLILRAGGDDYVRSIRKVHEDGSLSFYCAIDEGLVLTVARAVDLVDNLRATLSEASTGISRPDLVIGFECLYRRLEAERRGVADEMGALMADNNVIGFHGYGEQANALHINQTFTGIVLGGSS